VKLPRNQELRDLILLPVTTLLAWLSVLLGTAGAVENVLLGRPATLSTPPNYPSARDGADTVLTDGREASGLYWRNGTSLGWEWRSTVLVSIELKAPAPVGLVRIQAGAKLSGEVYFPSQLLVYGGDHSGRTAFLGASAMGRDEDSPSEGTLRQFEIAFEPRVVSRIVVVAFTRGEYLFLGEIEALSAPQGAPLQPAYETLEALRADAVVRRQAAIAALPRSKPTGPSLAQRWAMPIAAQTATAGGDLSCVVERIEPWPDHSGEERTLAQDAPLIALVGGHDYAAFRFVNRTSDPLTVRLAAADKSRAQVSFYALAYAQALNYAWVADVLTPIDGRIELPSGSQLLVMAEVAPTEPGKGLMRIETACGSSASAYDIPLAAITPMTSIPPLHGTMWAYIHEPEQRMVAQALTCDPAALVRLGLDTEVVHPDALYHKGAGRPQQLLRRYFRAYRGAKRLLLWMDVKTLAWTFKSLPDREATASLKAWWDWVNEIARAEGVDAEMILYPIDEPQPEDVPLLLRTRDLFRKAGGSAKIYSTVEHKTAQLVSWLDIMQLQRPSPISRSLLSVPELDAYDSRPDGKLISLNAYYRMQGWQAFDLRLTGIGLWALWDSSGLTDPHSGWNPFLGTREHDFGLLYASYGPKLVTA